MVTSVIPVKLSLSLRAEIERVRRTRIATSDFTDLISKKSPFIDGKMLMRTRLSSFPNCYGHNLAPVRGIIADDFLRLERRQ